MQQIKRAKGIHSAGWILYAIIDHIIDMHILLVNQIVLEGEALEQLVMVLSEKEQDDMLLRLAVARRRLANMIARLLPKRAILHFLIRREDPLIHNTVKIYLRDVLDHVVRMIEKLKITNSLLDSVNQTYLAKVSIAVSKASNDANSIMKAFGAVATVFLPLSFLTGLFGMNVRVPGEFSDSIIWFFTIGGALSIMTVVGLLFFRWKHWI